MAGTHIFISYRREDAAGHAGRLYDRLVQQFGEAQVFLDFNAIPGATDFTEEIREALGRANVVLVVIGPRWLTAAGDRGRPRLQDPNDLVRAEIRTALRSKVAVIPVLVGGAEMPTRDQLPSDLSDLHTINAIEVSDRRFSGDVDNLIGTIARVQQTTVPVTTAAEIHAGHWEICKTMFRMASATILVELHRDGALSGRLAGMGSAAGETLKALGGMPDMQAIMGPFAQMTGQITYSGTWNYDVASKVLTLQLVDQIPGFGGGGETWQMRITGSDRGVYQAVDQAMMQYTLKRIG